MTKEIDKKNKFYKNTINWIRDNNENCFFKQKNAKPIAETNKINLHFNYFFAIVCSI
jgi:hypothetical protein